MTTGRWVAGVLLSVAASGLANAQPRPLARAGNAESTQGRGGRVGAPRPAPARIAAERRLLDRFFEIVRDTLGLNADQMAKVRQIDLATARDRFNLEDEERHLRRDLRLMMERRGTVDQDSVSRIWTRLLRVQRQRLNLLEREDVQLTPLLTPIQRVKYHTMRDNLRVKMDQLLGVPPADVPGARGGRRGGPPAAKRDTTAR